MDDITLRAFEKYRALKILQKYLRETFSRYFAIAAHAREISRVYTCKRYDLEREVLLTRKILSFLS